MAEIVTVARPYAEAVFRLAKEKGALEAWSGMLQYLSVVVQDAGMQSCITDPSVTPSQLEGLVTAVSAGKLSDMGVNFVKELIHNGRLAVVPQIAELFETLKAEEGGMLEARVISAYPMTKAQLGELVKKLEGKFNKKVEASAEVDSGLIGGVKIEIGDDVIDASVRGKLQAMAFALTR